MTPRGGRMQLSARVDQAATRVPPRFRVLGEVTVDGRKDGPPQERAVLAVLLLHAQHVVTTDALIEALWGEDPPKTAHHSIQVHVSELRRRLGTGSIQTTPNGYRLTEDPDDIDWSCFERAVRAAEAIHDLPVRRHLLAEAIALWEGDPLEDIGALLTCDVGEQRLADLLLVAVERWARLSLELGDSAGLVPELGALVQEHPLHEPLWACFIEALAQAGRQPEALHAFNRLRANLAEVGLEPTAELRAIEERILLSGGGASTSSTDQRMRLDRTEYRTDRAARWDDFAEAEKWRVVWGVTWRALAASTIVYLATLVVRLLSAL